MKAETRTNEQHMERTLVDAVSYLDAVKAHFQDSPDVYNHFLDIMRAFRSYV